MKKGAFSLVAPRSPLRACPKFAKFKIEYPLCTRPLPDFLGSDSRCVGQSPLSPIERKFARQNEFWISLAHGAQTFQQTRTCLSASQDMVRQATAMPSKTQSSRNQQWEQISDSEGSQENEEGLPSGSEQESDDEDGEFEEEKDGATANYAQFQGESDEDEEDVSDSDEGDEDEEANDDGGDEEGASDYNGGSGDEFDQRRASSSRQAPTEDDIRKKMSNIPFSALVKARKSIDAPASDDDVDAFEEEDEWADERARVSRRAAKGKGRGRDDDDDDDEQETKRHEVRERLKALSGRGRRRMSNGDDEEASGSDDEADEREPSRKSTLAKRQNKHAPTEMSTRRPVSRKRSVIESQSREVRDPRFSNLSGPEVNSGLFQRSYGFVSDMQSSELSTLKATLSKLRKLEANHAGPKATSERAMNIRAEREQVERTLKREEAKAAERSRRQREREVLGKFKAENEERVKQGGKRFYLKESDKRKMMLEDKFARLAKGKQRGGAAGDSTEQQGALPASSSSKALRKAIDKRRRKNAAKERKSMPFLEAGRRGGGGEGSWPIPQRRRSGGDGGGDGNKRQRRR